MYTESLTVFSIIRDINLVRGGGRPHTVLPTRITDCEPRGVDAKAGANTVLPVSKRAEPTLGRARIRYPALPLPDRVGPTPRRVEIRF